MKKTIIQLIKHTPAPIVGAIFVMLTPFILIYNALAGIVRGFRRVGESMKNACEPPKQTVVPDAARTEQDDWMRIPYKPDPWSHPKQPTPLVRFINETEEEHKRRVDADFLERLTPKPE